MRSWASQSTTARDLRIVSPYKQTDTGAIAVAVVVVVVAVAVAAIALLLLFYCCYSQFGKDFLPVRFLIRRFLYNS